MRYILLLVAAVSLAACGQSEPTAADTNAAAAEEVGGNIVTTGTFSGLSDHITTGGVTIRQDGDTFYVVLEEDFSLDGAPDPKLGFGDGEYIIETQFSELKNKDGYQTYKLPAGLDPTQYSQIYVWCEQFSVPLGMASINQ